MGNEMINMIIFWFLFLDEKNERGLVVVGGGGGGGGESTCMNRTSELQFFWGP